MYSRSCDPGYNADRRSAGYRDVLLNMRVGTEATRWLGLDMHVCELQLVLKAVAEVLAQLYLCVCVDVDVGDCLSLCLCCVRVC
jgi:hypothetical protein